MVSHTCHPAITVPEALQNKPDVVLDQIVAQSGIQISFLFVSLDNIPLSTGFVKFTRDVSNVTIYFVTSSSCHEERLRLFYDVVRSCEPSM